MRADRELSHRREIFALELVFPVDPVLPGVIQRQAEYPLELGVIGTFTVCGALDPLDELLR